jgi:DedD protein
VPSAPTSSEAGAPAPAPVRDKAVAAEDSVDKGEEIVDTPPPKAAAAALPAPPAAPAARTEPKTEHKPEHKEAKPEHKEAKPEHKEPKPEHKAETRLADKPVKPKAEDKPAKSAHEDARALAILEGKAAEKADKEKPADAGSQKVTLQVAAMSSQEKAAELQARLRGAGISSHTEKFGELIRVKVGPLSKDEADRVRAKLGKLGL